MQLECSDADRLGSGSFRWILDDPTATEGSARIRYSTCAMIGITKPEKHDWRIKMKVEDRISYFRAELPHGSAVDLVRKHITSGECFALSPNSYFDLKARVAGKFRIHPAEVVVVVSAKLGFSLAPEKR